MFNMCHVEGQTKVRFEQGMCETWVRHLLDICEMRMSHCLWVRHRWNILWWDIGEIAVRHECDMSETCETLVSERNQCFVCLGSNQCESAHWTKPHQCGSAHGKKTHQCGGAHRTKPHQCGSAHRTKFHQCESAHRTKPHQCGRAILMKLSWCLNLFTSMMIVFKKQNEVWGEQSQNPNYSKFFKTQLLLTKDIK